MLVGVIIFLVLCTIPPFFFGVTILYNLLQYKRVVNGWETRSNGWPIGSPPLSLARMNNAIYDECRAQSLPELYEKHRMLSRIRINWVLRDETLEKDGYAMHILDPWERKNDKGDIWRIAGWTSNGVVNVVYKQGVLLKDTAYLHECIHLLQKTLDYSHSDEFYWGDDGLEKKIMARYLRTHPF